jgi:hypothetical protein
MRLPGTAKKSLPKQKPAPWNDLATDLIGLRQVSP